MNPKSITRRKFLGEAGKLTLAGSVVFYAGCSREMCAKPDSLSRGDLSLRTSVKYTESSPHGDRNCANCAMFVPPDGGACGGCQFLSGPVNASGHCESWSAKG